jgi:hypothetical protein
LVTSGYQRLPAVTRTYWSVIPTKSARFFNQEELFGRAVASEFPDAAVEIKEAGDCIAAGLKTAAVFHLMRIAEIGVRAIAPECGIATGCPIEFATWSAVIGAMDTALKQVKQQPKSELRERNIQFYATLQAEMRAFQCAWRDPVMHARTRFDTDGEAEVILLHVKRFMDTLASRPK